MLYLWVKAFHVIAIIPHIFNLGHRVLPGTPIPPVEHLIARVRGAEA